MGGRVTPQEARALVSSELRDRDQHDADKWQVLSHLTTLILLFCSTAATWCSACKTIGSLNLPYKHDSARVAFQTPMHGPDGSVDCAQ